MEKERRREKRSMEDGKENTKGGNCDGKEDIDKEKWMIRREELKMNVMRKCTRG